MAMAKNDLLWKKCPKCGDGQPPVCAPRIAAWVIIPTAWIVLLAWGAVAFVLMPLNLVLVPCWLACACAVGPLHRKLLDPKCGACGETRGSATTVAYLAGSSAGPSNERSVKGRLIGEAE